MKPDIKTNIGWQPACTHDAGPIPCTVFDPFSGTATVGVVAQRHGRKFVGLELSLEYIRLAKERRAKGNGYHVGETAVILLHFAALFAIWLIALGLIAWSMAASVRAETGNMPTSEADSSGGEGLDVDD